MSITRLRELMAKKGCQIPMMIIGLLLIVGFALLGSFPSAFNRGGDQQNVSLATVGKTPVSAALFDAMYTDATKNYPVEITGQPETRVMIYQGVMSQVAMMAAVQDMADEQKLKVEDKDVVAEWEKQLNDKVKQMTDQLKAMGKIKDGASQADIDKALAEATGGRAPKDIIAQMLGDQKKNLEDPARRLLAVAPLLQQRLLEDAKKSVTYTEEELKKSFDQFTFEVVQFKKKDQADEAAQADAAKGLADLKAGKTMDEVRKAYGRVLGKDEKPTQSVSRGALDADTANKDLPNLKPGELSGVISQFGEVKVLKLVSVEPKLPPDFETSKGGLIDAKKAELANKKLSAALTKRVKETMKWNSAGFGALHKYVMLSADDVPMDEAKRLAALKEIVSGLAAVTDDAPRGKEALALTHLACASDLYQAAKTPEDKKLWGKAKLDALTMCFDFADSVQSRLSAVRLASETEDKDALSIHMLEAARNNALFDARGAQVNTELTQMLSKAKEAKSLTPDQEGAVQKELDRWQTEKVAFEKDQAELEKEKRAADAEAKAATEKVAAEEAKALEKEKGAPARAPQEAAKPSPVPVIPVAPGGK